VWLNITDYHFTGGVCGAKVVRRFEHRVRFANTGGRAKENAQPPALGASFFGLYVCEKLVGVRPGGVGELLRLTYSRLSVRPTLDSARGH
jgi:hypothetical protein